MAAHRSGDSDAIGGDTDHDAVAAAQGGQVLCAVEHQVGSANQQQLIL